MIRNTYSEAGARFFRHALYAVWQILPLDFASGIGSVLVRIIALRYRRTTAATRNALRRVNPAYTEAELDRILFNMWQNMGRVWAEALIAHRLTEQRLRVAGLENLEQAKSLGRPIITPFVHTGNWEIASSMLAANHLTPHSIAEPLRRRVFYNLISRVREDSGLVVVTPDLAGTRQIYRYLERGDTMCIAIDAYKDGIVQKPDFGRHLTGPDNLEFTLRLAARFHAVLLPMHVVRLHGADFELHISPPLPPAVLETSAGREGIKKDLENWCERTVRMYIDQWYMLHRLRFTPKRAAN